MTYPSFSKLQCITLTGMFTAIIFVLTFTPLGFPQIPLIGSATIIHIPVIIGAILMGPKYGAVLGFMFGLSSMIFASTQSVALNAFAFTPLRPVPGTDNGSPWALIVAFVPRILVGIITPLVFIALTKIFDIVIKNAGKNNKAMFVKFAAAAVVGSLTNTLLVLNLLYLLFREPWSYAREGSAAIQREAVYVANEAAAAAWEIAQAFASNMNWVSAAEYARTAVTYEQAAATAYAAVITPQITYAFIMGIIAGFGVPEAIAAGVIAPAVCIALFAVTRRLPVQRAS